MSALSRAARCWLGDYVVDEDDEISISPITLGIAAARRTGLTHHVADAAELSDGEHSTLAARWLCGGSTVDGIAFRDGETVDCVHCRLTAAVPAGPTVYLAWGDDDELLYVGSTKKAAQRLRSHQHSTRWWSEVRRVTFEPVDDQADLRRREYELIAERPGKHNREGFRRPAAKDPLLALVSEADEAS